MVGGESGNGGKGMIKVGTQKPKSNPGGDVIHTEVVTSSRMGQSQDVLEFCLHVVCPFYALTSQ